MNKKFIWGLLMVAAVPTAIWAADQNITVSATAQKFCSFYPTPSVSNPTNINTISPGIPVTTVSIPNPTDSSGIMQDFAFDFVITAKCNAPSQIQLKTLNGGIRDTSLPAAPPPGFLNRIDYSAHASWDGASPSTLVTNDNPGGMSPLRLASGPFAGSVSVTVGALLNQSAPLVAGAYSDTITIMLNPQ